MSFNPILPGLYRPFPCPGIFRAKDISNFIEIKEVKKFEIGWMVLHDTKGGSGHTFSTLPPVVIGLRKKDTKNNDNYRDAARFSIPGGQAVMWWV